MAKSLASAATFLDNHSKRDTVVRTVQFGALFLGGVSKRRCPLLSEKLMIVCSEFSHARLILRMIDDIPMLAYTLKCFFAREGANGFLHWSTIVSNLSCQIYYPLEHLAWLADSKLVPVSSNRLWKYAILCWVIYSAIQLIQCLYKLRMKQLRKQKSTVLLSLGLQYICDLLCGLHWMTCGPLSNKLSDTVVGLLGTISSIIRLHHSLNQ